jgi:L-cysteate sulfo-lyase
MRLNTIPRIRLASLPTPLQELKNLSTVLQGPRIYIKRDDLTGLALGGNKTRKLEYLMAEAVQHGADYIVTGAGFQSNWCTQAAAAARKLGMGIVLVKKGPSEHYDPKDYDGNHLLHFLQGAAMKVVRPEDFQKTIEKTMEELKADGHKPFHLADTGSTPPGVAAYVTCILEILYQAVDLGINIDYLVHTSGSGGTQAGLIIGAKAFNSGIKVLASTTGSRPSSQQRTNIHNLMEQSLRFLDKKMEVYGEDINLDDTHAGVGYGFMSQGKAEAIKLLAETEGVMLDPVYTASSMALLIDLCRKKFFNPRDVVVFLHTGGSAALFPYKETLKAYARGETPPWTVPPWSPTV